MNDMNRIRVIKGENWTLCLNHTPDDPEKLVLPGIVFVDKLQEKNEFRGFAICIGWWHWGIQLTVALNLHENT